MPFRRLLPAATVLVLTVLLPSMSPLQAENRKYNYISPEDLKTRIESGFRQCILDIQIPEEYTDHHIRDAVPTYAYPVKTEVEKDRIDTAVAQLTGNKDPIVIVCPRGGGGAERTYDYLLEKGIEADRLYILEKGQGGWPYENLLEK